MKKLLVYLCAIILVISSAGCSNVSDTATDSTAAPETTQGKQSVQVDIVALKADIVQQMQIEDSMDLAKESLSDMYGIDLADVKEFACCVAMGGAFVEEILLLACVDDAAVERIEKKLQVKLSDAMDMAQNYDAQSYAIYKSCKVQKNGTYVALFVSDKAEQMQKMFDDAVK